MLTVCHELSQGIHPEESRSVRYARISEGNGSRTTGTFSPYNRVCFLSSDGLDSPLAQASDADEAKAHTREIEGQLQKISQAMYDQRSGESEEETLARAMRDPEVASIMQDPVIQQILQQAQSEPRALQDHMKNPMIREKIQKLVAAGIIKTR